MKYAAAVSRAIGALTTIGGVESPEEIKVANMNDAADKIATATK